MPSERKHPSPATEQYVRGMELYRHGRFEEAAAELAGVQDRSDPMGRVARFHAGMAWRNLGVEALAQGRFDHAEKHFRAAIDAVGPQADLAGYLAAVYARTHRYERCAAQMKRAIDCGGDDAAARRRLAQAQWRTGRRPQAYMTLAEAVRRFGPQAHLHFQLGLFYAAQARYAEARDSMKRATDADCTNGRMHYYLALTAAAMGDAPAAVRSFQRAFALRPNDLMGAYQLALAARVAGRAGCRVVVRLPEPTAAPAPTGTRQLARYVAGEPDFVESFLALPASGIDSELFGLLAGVLEAALAEHPDYADLHWLASRVHERLGRLVPAIGHARRAVQINPNYVQGLVQLARLAERAGQDAEAAALLEKAIDRGADWPDLHAHAAELLGRCAATAAARRHLARARQLETNRARAAEAPAAPAA